MSDAPVLKSGITLAVIAAVCTSLVAVTYQMTRERIAANEQAWLEQSLQPALSGLFFSVRLRQQIRLERQKAADLLRNYRGAVA